VDAIASNKCSQGLYLHIHVVLSSLKLGVEGSRFAREGSVGLEDAGAATEMHWVSPSVCGTVTSWEKERV
jgi:hypothetical protein